MKRIDLQTCTKEELKTKIIDTVNEYKNMVYVVLDSRHNEKPQLELRRVAEGMPTFGQFEYIGKNNFKVLNEVWADDEYYDNFDNYLNDLYSHIVEVYQ